MQLRHLWRNDDMDGVRDGVHGIRGVHGVDNDVRSGAHDEDDDHGVRNGDLKRSSYIMKQFVENFKVSRKVN